ncbi:MAG: hypothetical protein OM95_03590 [Bdellovibrio sp. ArHS]|uniref:bacteriohemerythrin n=1 Tax=Bdellovibrio sp. ArHS TaxID=1569284 RepID=UPI000583F920|nr:bacteriohemerythrin [Bdellovibrio sp. ArHS]KHD89458.1 MAG: hypothetical protein OM95_03590 [Bdellovibrio sp. ArHS]
MTRNFNFQWDDSLVIGVDTMDQDHQKLIQLMNEVYRLFKKNAAHSDIEKSMDQLGDFVVEHFQREERYFDSLPDYEDGLIHKAIHKKLLARYSSFLEEFKKGKEIKEDFFYFLKAWLVAHIEGVDAKYAEHP